MEWILHAQAWARMSASRPEADSEYSRGGSRSREGSDPRATRSAAGRRRPDRARASAVLGLGLVGAILLAVAELTPLLQVVAGSHGHVVSSIQTGPHHAYALVPIAVAAGVLGWVAWASGSRLALAAIGLLGLAALGVALLGDLPAVHSSGLVGRPATGLAEAHARAAVGLYLETLGAIVLVVTAAAGMLLAPAVPGGSRRPAGGEPSRSRSAS